MSTKQDNNSEEDSPKRRHSMSDYYPKGTTYFYGFPVGENSNFFNLVPPWKEELVAARPMICAGDNLKVVVFSSTIDSEIWGLMTEHLQIPLINKARILPFPEEITSKLKGNKRNKAIRSALLKTLKKKKFVMAQPYQNEGLTDRYLIDPEVSIFLNDKVNLSTYINKKYLPKKYQYFLNGKEFAEDKTIPPLPCVVKVSSSSAGDGVKICFTKKQFEEAKVAFSRLKVKIINEEYIHSVLNLGIQFGMTKDGKKKEIIGFNEQFIDSKGGYLGGVISPNSKYPILPKIFKVLTKEILPKVHKLGWFGVGGIDVLIDKNGGMFFIDPNFRMTAATSYLFMNKNKEIPRPLISFMGKFRGSKKDFIEKIVPLAKEGSKNQMLKIVSLTKRSKSYGINAGIFFNDNKELKKNAKLLNELGVEGSTIDRILNAKH